MNESSSYSFIPVHLLNWPKLCLISTICQVTSENYKEVFSFWQPCPQVMPFFGDEAVNWNRVELQGHLCERLAIRGGSTCLHRLKGSTFEKLQLDWLFAMIYISYLSAWQWCWICWMINVIGWGEIQNWFISSALVSFFRCYSRLSRWQWASRLIPWEVFQHILMKW